MAEVVVLKEGRKNREVRGGILYRSPCHSSVTLVKSNVNVVVDTGGAGDTHVISQRLREEGLRPYDVDYVVNTHWHPDHTSNNNLFENAKTILGDTVWMPGANENYSPWTSDVEGIDEVEVIKTPGHTLLHNSVRVDAERSYVLAGDAFYDCDLRKGSIPKSYTSLEDFKRSALNILEVADVIVPGHGCVIELSEGLRNEYIELVGRL